jgi:hypothetical protein
VTIDRVIFTILSPCRDAVDKQGRSRTGVNGLIDALKTVRDKTER